MPASASSIEGAPPDFFNLTKTNKLMPARRCIFGRCSARLPTSIGCLASAQSHLDRWSFPRCPARLPTSIGCLASGQSHLNRCSFQILAPKNHHCTLDFHRQNCHQLRLHRHRSNSCGHLPSTLEFCRRSVLSAKPILQHLCCNKRVPQSFWLR